MILAKIDNAFTNLNFKRVNIKRFWAFRSYEGELILKGSKVPVVIDILDREFVELPVIYLKERPDIKGFPIHLNYRNNLCYFDKSSIVLDRYNIEGSVKMCIQQAETILEKVIQGKAIDDIPPEFNIYWSGIPTFTNLKNGEDQLGSLYFREQNGFYSAYITTGFDFLLKYFKLLGEDHEDAAKLKPIPTFLVNSKKIPFIYEKDWPPKVLGHFIEWLKEFDSSLIEKLKLQLKNPEFIKSGHVGFIFDTPSGQFGIDFIILVSEKFPLYLDKRQRYSNFDKAFLDLTREDSEKGTFNWRRKGDKNVIIDFLFQGAGRDLPIDRLNCEPIDHHFIHGRNLVSQKSLANKKILLIGCGTIGGYLASFLSKHGAGAAEKGELILLDKETLSSGNLGRHILGMTYIGRYKSEALKEQLLLELPHLNISSSIANFNLYSVPWKVDLIIDATGEEPLSILLNHQVSNRRRRCQVSPTIIYSWIRGPGLAVQSFLDDGKSACLQCLKIKQENGLYKDRFSLVKDEDEDFLLTDRCSATFAPFLVSASAHAASLTLDMVMAWNNEVVENNFKTIRIDHQKTIQIEDCNPQKKINCEECGINIITE